MPAEGTGYDSGDMSSFLPAVMSCVPKYRHLIYLVSHAKYNNYNSLLRNCEGKVWNLHYNKNY